MNFVRAIAESRKDEFAHRCFVRYGLGEYEKEPLEITRTSSKVKLKGGFEYVNVFHGFMAGLAEGKVAVQGSIVTSKDIKGVLNGLGLEPKAIEKLRGKKAFRYVLDTELTLSTYKNLFSKVFDCFMLFSANDSMGRHVRVKSDKPPKIGTPKPGFASLELPVSDFGAVCDEFVFDVPEARDAKRISIAHTYIIKEIIIPKGFEDDPQMARMKAVRKGEIRRVVAVDGKQYVSKIKLEV